MRISDVEIISTLTPRRRGLKNVADTPGGMHARADKGNLGDLLVGEEVLEADLPTHGFERVVALPTTPCGQVKVTSVRRSMRLDVLDDHVDIDARIG